MNNKTNATQMGNAPQKGSACHFLTGLGVAALVIRGKGCLTTGLTRDKQAQQESDSAATEPESTGDKARKLQNTESLGRQLPGERPATGVPPQSFHISEVGDWQGLFTDTCTPQEMYNNNIFDIQGHRCSGD